MAHDRETEVWRTKDGRAWRIGCDAEIAWIRENTGGGRAITSAIPPVFEAYATLELPGIGDHDAASWLEDPDRHDASVLAVLSEHSAAQPWWLGYLDTGAADVVFYDVRKVTLHSGWEYVLIEAGPGQAGVWRDDEHWKGVLPDLMFPADRSWLVSTSRPATPGSRNRSIGHGRDSARAHRDLIDGLPLRRQSGSDAEIAPTEDGRARARRDCQDDRLRPRAGRALLARCPSDTCWQAARLLLSAPCSSGRHARDYSSSGTKHGSGLLGSTKLVLRHDDAEEMLAGAIQSQHPATTLPLVTASLAAGPYARVDAHTVLAFKRP